MGIARQTKIDIVQMFSKTLENLVSFSDSLGKKIAELGKIVSSHSADIDRWGIESRGLSIMIREVERRCLTAQKHNENPASSQAFNSWRAEMVTCLKAIEYFKKDLDKLKTEKKVSADHIFEKWRKDEQAVLADVGQMKERIDDLEALLVEHNHTIRSLKRERTKTKNVIDNMKSAINQQKRNVSQTQWYGAMYSMCHPDERSFVALPM